MDFVKLIRRKKNHFVYTLIKHQDRRDGFRVIHNTVICKKHFNKEDIHKAIGRE